MSNEGLKAAHEAAIAASSRNIAAPVASAAPSGFDQWARDEGLIQESHGIRSVNSMTDLARKAWQAAIAHQPPKEALILQKINELAAKHIKDIAGYDRPIEPMNENHEFIVLCRAIEAASAPNKQLVAALKELRRSMAYGAGFESQQEFWDAVEGVDAALAAAGEVQS